MADNPILDNTKALEEMIAAMKQQAAPTNAPLPVASMYRSIDTLTRSMQELARVYAQGATPGSLAAQYARRQVERRRREVGERFGQLGPQGQVATMPVMRAMQEVEQRRKTPPLGDTISELQKRLDAYQNLREQGAEPGSLAAKAARAKIAEQEKLVGRSFGNLSPQQQAMALPAMQALEQQRQQVLQEEVQRREKLNRGLGTSTSALYRFSEGVARGNPIGGAASALGGLGPVGGLLGTAISSLAGLLTTLENERLTGIHRGGAALSPSGAQTETMSVQLREMAEAQQTGELGRQTEQARMEQLRRQARKMGMTEEGDPRGTFQRLMRSQEEIIRRYEDLFQGHSAPERSARQAGRVSARYEEFIRSQGGTPEAMKFDIPNLAQPGYTTARRYHEELQVGALQREDLSNEKFKEQTAILRQMGLLLEGIKENTNGLENLRPRWS